MDIGCCYRRGNFKLKMRNFQVMLCTNTTSQPSVSNSTTRPLAERVGNTVFCGFGPLRKMKMHEIRHETLLFSFSGFVALRITSGGPVIMICGRAQEKYGNMHALNSSGCSERLTKLGTLLEEIGVRAWRKVATPKGYGQGEKMLSEAARKREQVFVLTFSFSCYWISSPSLFCFLLSFLLLCL